MGGQGSNLDILRFVLEASPVIERLTAEPGRETLNI